MAVNDRWVTAPDSFVDDDNWRGGFYELSIEIGETSDERLERTLGSLWRAAGIRGCYGSREREIDAQSVISCTVESLDRFGQLRGVVDLPGGGRVVCGAVAVREDAGADWLDFFLPMGALAGAERRVGGFPFGDDGGVASMVWRRPIDVWLAEVGGRVHTTVDYRLGVIGFEASGQVRSEQVGSVALMPEFGYLLPQSGGIRYVPATR